MKILVIDDERSIRNSLKEILIDEGYEVEDVLVNGKSVMDKVTFKLDTAKYALKAANKNYVIEVKFAEITD